MRDFAQQPIAAAMAALAVVNAGLGIMLVVAGARGFLLAALPVVAVGLGALMASSRAIIVYAAIGLPLLSPLPLTEPVAVGGGSRVYLSDVLVLLAVGSWIAASLVGDEQSRPSSPRTPVLGWPLVLFGTALLVAVARGNELYGTSLVSVPIRLLVYAGIAFAVTDLDTRSAYRWIVVVFYAGTVWQTLVVLHGVATGTSATDQVLLSTGGERVLAGSAAMFMAGALLLALLNLEQERDARRASLHLLIAGLATVTLAYTFQRTTFVLIGVLVPLFLVVFRRVPARLALYLPLLLPFLVLAALLVPRADPELVPTLTERITASPSTDASVSWRREATDAVMRQIDENRLVGSGFGRTATFEIDEQRYTISQDPHNQFLYLWAGGGLVLLGSFFLLLLVYLLDAWKRFRTGGDEDRRLLVWTVSLWFVFTVNGATGIVLTSPPLLLVYWILLTMPIVVRPRGGDHSVPA